MSSSPKPPDELFGRRFGRREALARFGVVSAGALLAACGDGGDGGGSTRVTSTEGETATVEPKTPTSGSLASRFDESASCEQTVELTEGPYYIDIDRVRSDIREDRDGTLLRVGVRVRDAGTCEPIPNAAVELWHCDATGGYSGVQSDDATYLRGTQVTNDDGIAQFTTIYPGWYPGRTVHIHAKVFLDRQTVLTSQLFFDDATTAEVYADEPYASAQGRDVSNDADGIYQPQLELSVSQEDAGWLGLITFDVRQV